VNSPVEGIEEIAQPKRQGAEQAIQLALESKWEEAAVLNRNLLSTHPSDVDAWNRLGKSLLELGRYRDASDAYGKALDLDPVNSIAKRNIERLSAIKDAEQPRRADAVAKVAQDLFIEEVGKSGTSVLRGVPTAAMVGLTAGDEVYLKPGDTLINVETIQGEVIGNIEAKLGLRLLRLIKGGNRYAAAVKSISGDSDVELIIKEVYRDPSQTKLSFPAVGGEGIRPYIKESLLRLNADDDDDDEVEAEIDDWEAEPEPSETAVTFSSFQSVIERDVDDDDEEEV
jgi:tetratricopeptide (TPR) repeat protein